VPKNILIADDDPAILELLKEHFGKLGYAVHVAQDGLQLASWLRGSSRTSSSRTS
jgi:DNA-binding response OmpR family regulator